jgi:hypothetical protein
MTILNSGGTTLSTLWKEVDPRTCVLVSTFFQRVDTYSTSLCTCSTLYSSNRDTPGGGVVVFSLRCEPYLCTLFQESLDCRTFCNISNAYDCRPSAARTQNSAHKWRQGRGTIAPQVRKTTKDPLELKKPILPWKRHAESYSIWTKVS